MADPGAELIRLVNDYQTSQALYVAATLRLPDLLAGGPKGADDLAAATDSHAASLYELLHELAAVGVFEEKPEKVFAATRLSELLRSDRPVPFTHWARFVGRPCDGPASARRLQNVRTGKSARSRSTA
jgi:hypothetical protein